MGLGWGSCRAVGSSIGLGAPVGLGGGSYRDEGSYKDGGSYRDGGVPMGRGGRAVLQLLSAFHWGVGGTQHPWVSPPPPPHSGRQRHIPSPHPRPPPSVAPLFGAEGLCVPPQLGGGGGETAASAMAAPRCVGGVLGGFGMLGRGPIGAGGSWGGPMILVIMGGVLCGGSY